MIYRGILHNAQQGRQVIERAWAAAKPWLIAEHRLVVKIEPESRNGEQNALLWVYLDAFAKQLKWPVNGAMVSLDSWEWKDVLSAAFKNETQRIAMGLNGGMVILGMRTSKLGKARFAEFLDFIAAVAVERGVLIEEQAPPRVDMPQEVEA